MPVDKESKFSEFMAALRQEGLPAIKVRLLAWVEACREEPRLILHSPGARIITYVVVGLLVMKLGSCLLSLRNPGGPEPAPFARTADFHVVCTNADCNHHFVIHRKFGFDDFPITCPKCGRSTGMHAQRCVSDTCKGRWVAPVKRKNGVFCPVCDSRLGSGN